MCAKKILNIDINEQNSKIYKIGKSCTTNVINRVTGQIDIIRFDRYKRVYRPKDKNKKILAISKLLNYEVYSKLEKDLHKKIIMLKQYAKNRLGKSEDFT